MVWRPKSYIQDGDASDSYKDDATEDEAPSCLGFLAVPLGILSGLYALVIIVLGLVFPLSFYLSGGLYDDSVYLSRNAVLVFHVYIATVSLAFLAYIYVSMFIHGRPEDNPRPKATFSTPSAAPSVLTPEINIISPSGDKAESPGVGMVNPPTFEECIQATRRPSQEPGPSTLCPRRGSLPILERRGSIPLGFGLKPRSHNHSGGLHGNVDHAAGDDAPAFMFAGEGVNFYLRLGAVGFGMAAVVMESFQLLQYAEDDGAWGCYGTFFIVHTCLRLCFLFTQTHFIFKYHKLIINHRKPLMRLGFLHLVATNLSIWAMNVTYEAAHSFAHEVEVLNKGKAAAAYTNGSADAGGYADVYGSAVQNYTASYGPKKSVCKAMKLTLSDKAAPYLYPCYIEFTLIAAAVFYHLYMHVGAHVEPEHEECTASKNDDSDRGVECHKANRGLFLGLLIFSMTAIAACIFLLYKSDTTVLGGGSVTVIVYFISDIIVAAVATVALVIAFWKVSRLHFTEHLESNFDQNLVLVTMAGHLLLVTFMAIPAVAHLKEPGYVSLYAKLQLSACVLTFFQALLQVAFMIDALRRRCATEQHLDEKPGRSLVTFLLICNVSIWIIDVFELKQAHSAALLKGSFGSLTWIIIMHVCLPLAIFFRFHSSVCLSDIWTNSYRQNCACQGPLLPPDQAFYSTL